MQMKNLFTQSLIPILLISASTAFANCGPLLNETVQKTIDTYRTENNIPAIQASVFCPGENQPRDFISGTKTKEGADPIKADTLFQIGSETKSFIAAIILQLEADGLLSIEDDIGTWLPQLPAHWKKITIKQLLNHTSGLGVKYIYDDNGGYWLHAGETMDYSAIMAWLTCEDIFISITISAMFVEYEVLNELIAKFRPEKSCSSAQLIKKSAREHDFGHAIN
jgi:CubicO group peptidase (beta-lactamase class C family)